MPPSSSSVVLLSYARPTSKGSSGTAQPATQRLLSLKPKRRARPSHAPSSSFAEVSAARSQARGAERIRDNRFPTRGPESISRSPLQRRHIHQAWGPVLRRQLEEEVAQTPRDLRESLRDEAVAWFLPLKPKPLARPTQAPISKLQSRVVERARNNLRPTRRKDEEGLQTPRDLQAARHDEAVATTYRSWYRRREHTECIRQSDLEDWLADNQPLFDKLDVQVNMDLVLDVFNEKKEPLPFEERMLQGNEFFNLRYCPQYSPHADDRIGLFLRLLHHNMPMVSVAPVWSPKYNAWKPPTSSTVSGFVCLFTPRFKEVLGECPSLWKWQTAAEWFLRMWCPDGENNDVRWNDATRDHGIWSLTTFECRQIAYVTTHQYACVLLQYNALSS